MIMGSIPFRDLDFFFVVTPLWHAEYTESIF